MVPADQGRSSSQLVPFNTLTEKERTRALVRFNAIRPFLEHGIALAQLARSQKIALRTLWRWVEKYQKGGLPALSRKARVNQKGAAHHSSLLKQLVEGLALQQPRPSCATIHRKTIAYAKSRGGKPPSYATVYRIVHNLEPALLTLAHEGAAVYRETFDLLHRQEAKRPNVVWQADHTELDIWVIDEEGKAQKPWLTIVLDDYSRAIAGYFLSFRAPSAIQTALALRQAIWRKPQASWHVCGIPEALYIDHGSDFTSKHIEQVAADLKIRLIFSTIARPRGRGKVERFFETVTQVFLSRLPGARAPASASQSAKLRMADLAREFESFLLHEYHVTPHSTTGHSPQARWEENGFLPHMPVSLEQLDLLLLTVAKARCVHQDGIRFSGFRYIDPTLAAYVGEKVIVRYDPRDMAEVRVFYRNRFLCRAVCQELAGETVALREIVSARDRRRRELRQTIQDRKRVVDSLLETRRWTATEPNVAAPRLPVAGFTTLKRYINE
jgi:putative transposase